MPRPKNNELTKQSVRLYEADWNALDELFPGQSKNEVLRTILRSSLIALRAKRASAEKAQMEELTDTVELT